MARALLNTALAALAAPRFALADFKVLAEFAAVEYTWASAEERDSAIASGAFIPGNNVITGLKVCNPEVAARCAGEQRLFATVPRWLPGVPGTLNEVVVQEGSAPLLSPWPSKDAQDPSDCSKIQYVQSMEIDPEGVMWVVDVGRKYFNDEHAADNSCPPKMVLVDVVTAEVLDSYVFPSYVAPYTGAFLNDIVLDVEHQVGYISSTGNNATDLGAVIVYDRRARNSRRFEHRSSTHAEEHVFMIHGLPNEGVPTDGIALHPGGDRLFYSALSGYHLHSVSTAALRDFSLPSSDVIATVVDHGKKPSNSDGMAFGLDGSLFFGGLTTDCVYRWSPEMGDASNAEVLVNDAERLWWVDTFAFDNKGNLLLTSNKLSFFFSGAMDFTGASGGNFRIISVPVGTVSYLARDEGNFALA